ncbi:hypothetical protein BDW62DRAFT_175051 [Aspergillus aurantiobrunneus]
MSTDDDRCWSQRCLYPWIVRYKAWTGFACILAGYYRDLKRNSVVHVHKGSYFPLRC